VLSGGWHRETFGPAVLVSSGSCKYIDPSEIFNVPFEIGVRRCLVVGHILALMLLLFGRVACTATGDAGKVESIGAFTEQSASESVRNALEPQGYRAIRGDGSIVCDIWLRKDAPVKAPSSESGALYPFAESALVGVVSFPKPSVDCRGQTIRPGAYTLRYALLPNDANHLGAAPNRDFLLLIPVDADRDPHAAFTFVELTKMSTKASGTSHPASLNLISSEGQKDFPAVVEDEQKQVVFVAKLRTGSGAEVPLALVVVAVPGQ